MTAIIFGAILFLGLGAFVGYKHHTKNKSRIVSTTRESKSVNTDDLDKIRMGNVIYYEDVPGCGYPICINKRFWTPERVKDFTFDATYKSTIDKMTGRGATAKFKRMFYRCPDFFKDNQHLKCKESDIPKECEWLHQFQNWYEDNYGEQPKIIRGDLVLNDLYLIQENAT